jgi:hypothetical protein
MIIIIITIIIIIITIIIIIIIIITGLWEQASPTLMDLLSSHLILKSCGLCFLDETSTFEKVRELLVREFSTPIRSKNNGTKKYNQMHIHSKQVLLILFNCYDSILPKA